MSDERYFEDYVPGSVHDLGTISVSEAEIIEFAKDYDPQPFHIDPVAAKTGPFGGLIASGWHTTALMMRLFVEGYLSSASSLGSPGVDEVRWLRPVRPGDVLSVAAIVEDSRVSNSKPDRGLTRTRIEMTNVAGEPVLRMTAINLIRRRPTGGPS